MSDDPFRYTLDAVVDSLWRAFPPAEPLGDAIGRAVSNAIDDANPLARLALRESVSNPDTECDPHTCRLDHRPLSSGTADDWHGMDGTEGSCGR
jgi:hypothetical protein